MTNLRSLPRCFDHRHHGMSDLPTDRGRLRPHGILLFRITSYYAAVCLKHRTLPSPCKCDDPPRVQYFPARTPACRPVCSKGGGHHATQRTLMHRNLVSILLYLLPITSPTRCRICDSRLLSNRGGAEAKITSRWTLWQRQGSCIPSSRTLPHFTCFHCSISLCQIHGRMVVAQTPPGADQDTL